MSKNDASLLRRYEPLLRFTRGEKFFPMLVDEYVRASSLWVQSPGRHAECLIPQGEVNLEKLAEPRPGSANVVYYLRFIEPLDLVNLLTYLQKKFRETDPLSLFRKGSGRLARVGYLSRFADLIFSLSLLLRGRVPGDTSAAAAMEYEKILSNQVGYGYYGRVVRSAGWTILQYWYFYVFNNWRSGFFGVNDHEADWELVNVYLYETDKGEYVPEWVALSSHDHSGEGIVRRWGDPELEVVGENPVVYVAAGSHACYSIAGEYLTEIELPFFSPIARLTQRLLAAWRRLLGQDLGSAPFEGRSPDSSVFRAPFIDYARGDGLSIGVGGDCDWGEPQFLDPVPDWISQYSGLWGLYAHDPIAGEDAPAGPMYNRDGTYRRAWYDPLGWAGLDDVPPPNLAINHLIKEQEILRKDLANLVNEIEQKSGELNRLGVTYFALKSSSELLILEWEHQTKLEQLSKELAILREKRIGLEKVLGALQAHESRLRAREGAVPAPALHRDRRPATSSEIRSNRLMELWAALSIGLLLFGFVGLVLFYRQHFALGLVVMISLFIFIESSFRQRLDRLINSVAISLAVVAALVLIFEFFWQIAIGAVLFAGVFILWENVRELGSRR